MHVRNVHQRTLAASPDDVGALLDSLASADDRLWPRDRGGETTGKASP